MLLHKKIQKAATYGREESRSEAPDKRDTGGRGEGSRTGYTPVVPDRPFFFFSFTLFFIPSSWPLELCYSLVQTSGLRKSVFFSSPLLSSATRFFPQAFAVIQAGLSGPLCNSKMGTVQEGFFGLRFSLLVSLLPLFYIWLIFTPILLWDIELNHSVQIHQK